MNDASLFQKLFREINNAYETGILKDYLESVSPKELLLAACGTSTLLHFAYDRRIILKLVSVGIDINQQGDSGDTPIICRVRDDNVDAVAFMIALGANISLRNSADLSPLTIAIFKTKFKVARCLISNGARLTNQVLGQDALDLIPFEKGIIHCRDIVVTLLGLKKFRTLSTFRNIDKFLIKQELAVEIWSTRSCDY